MVAGALRLGLAGWVLVGGAAGLLTGLFFGDYCAVFRPIGTTYVMLLQAAVYPYVVCSLLHGLGSIRPDRAWLLFRRGWIFYVAAWAVTFGALFLLVQAIPEPPPRVTTAGGLDPVGVRRLLEILIPSDPITALSQNYVPAVVVFCIFYGIAIQTVEDKTAFLSFLETLRRASLKFWNWIVTLAPLAVFALFAYTAGTTAFADLARLSLYLGLFLVGAFLLAFWVLPALVAALTPLRHGEVLRALQAGMTISAVTTLSVVALPFITEATHKLAERCGIDDPERGDIIRTNLSISYPLGQLGNFFVYLFVAFAAYYYRTPIDQFEKALLPLVTLLSCVGSPTSTVNAVAFLSTWLPLPDGAPQLYVELTTVTRYGQVILSVAAFGFLSFLVTLSFYGKLTIKPMRVVMALVLPALVFAAVAAGAWQVERRAMSRDANPYLQFALTAADTAGVTVEFRDAGADGAGTGGDAGPAAAGAYDLNRIQRTGELRVGYNASIIPFCYRNQAGELVGYDVAYAYDLARSLNVKLVFVPFEWPSLQSDLLARRFDIAMAGIYVTEERLAQLAISKPYYQSPLALFLPRQRAAEYLSRQQIEAKQNLRLGVFNDPVLVPLLERVFPKAAVVIVPNYSVLPDFGRIDAAVWTLEQASALAAAHPGITAVAPSDLGSPLLFAYLLPPDSPEAVHFVNYWLELRRTDGFHQRQYDYWIKGQPPSRSAPRWSILRDVLGWAADAPS